MGALRLMARSPAGAARRNRLQILISVRLSHQLRAGTSRPAFHTSQFTVWSGASTALSRDEIPGRAGVGHRAGDIHVIGGALLKWIRSGAGDNRQTSGRRRARSDFGLHRGICVGHSRSHVVVDRPYLRNPLTPWATSGLSRTSDGGGGRHGRGRCRSQPPSGPCIVKVLDSRLGACRDNPVGDAVRNAGVVIR